MISTISSHGDAGDCVSLLPIARHLGKASVLVSNSRMCKNIVERIPILKELVESQPYIDRFDEWRGQEITHDVAPWRDGGVAYGWNLCRLHANWVGLHDVDESPWLTVDPDERFRDKIVINRSCRHRSDFFPWSEVMHHFPVEDMVFIGLPEEHQQHVNEFGINVPYHPTKDLNECAKIIAASKIVIANQSSNINIAIGLGKRFVLECSNTSVDCIYHRPDSIYNVDGEMELKVPGYKTLKTRSQIPEREIDPLVSAPGGYWIYDTKDGVRHKEVNGIDLKRTINNHERAANLPVSTMSDIAYQMGQHFPTFGQDGYLNQLIDRIHAVKKLIQEKQSPIVNEKVEV